MHCIPFITIFQFIDKINTILHFKRLGSRVSHDSFNQHVNDMYSSFQHNVHTAKQMQYTLEGILSDF